MHMCIYINTPNFACQIKNDFGSLFKIRCITMLKFLQAITKVFFHFRSVLQRRNVHVNSNELFFNLRKELVGDRCRKLTPLAKRLCRMFRQNKRSQKSKNLIHFLLQVIIMCSMNKQNYFSICVSLKNEYGSCIYFLNVK